MLSIEIVPFSRDNYAYILTSPCGDIAVIDPGQAQPIIDALKGRRLNLVICTHHHADHIGGAAELCDKYGAKLIANAKDGDTVNIGDEVLQVLSTAGHTMKSVCYYSQSSKAVFTGDTLFSLGCGRLFEGSPTQMWESFQKICALPHDTRIYCGHEYTLENAKFCEKVDPKNQDLKKRIIQAKTLRAQNLPTIPSTISQELFTNAFLRAKDKDTFALLREMKDNF